jgi:hypothetical protein
MPVFQVIQHYSRSEEHHNVAPDASLTASRPSLGFIKKYTSKVDSLDLSGPFSAWYAPGAKFYNGDGSVYDGGQQIWDWMHDLFSPFAQIEHVVTTTRVLDGVIAAGKTCDLLVLETETSFRLKEPLDGEAIRVPRLLMFLVGPATTQDDGTDGLQIWEAKAYWDTAVLGRAIRQRQASASRVDKA